MRRLARRVLTWVVRGRAERGAPWGEAILAELDQTTGTWPALRWAAGGIRVAWRERRRRRVAARRMAPLPARLARRIAIGAVLATLAALLLNQYVLTVRYIATASMAPTVHAGDRIVVDRLTFHWTGLRHGDVVVFALEATNGIKRVVGLPGEHISCEGGRLYRDSAPVDEPYLAAGSTLECAPVTVPPGMVYVLGDDRVISMDSRQWGPIRQDIVVGRLLTTLG